jgi:hypothetical protein
VVPLSYHDFFGGCATVAGALIGLLFVAISVSPEKLAGDRSSADLQVKAGAAFSALVNTLVIALVALLPGTGFGAAIIALASTGLASSSSCSPSRGPGSSLALGTRACCRPSPRWLSSR